MSRAAKKEEPWTWGSLVIEFIEEFCLVPEGKLMGQPVKLMEFQKDFILAVYDNPEGTRRAFLSMARKNGKTSTIAMLVLAHLVGPKAIRNSQIISGAQSREQASIVYDLAAKMVMLHPRLREIIRIIPSSKKLIGIPLNTSYHAISAEGKTAYGLSPILAILDEVGQVRGAQDDFIDAIITSQGAHAHPLLIAISTQAPNDADLFNEWMDDARKNKDKRIVCHVYEANIDCNLLDQAAWKAANPALGTFRDLEDLREQAERAQRMPSSEATFRNYGLNQRVEVFNPFVSRSVWMANNGKINTDAFYEGKVYAGIDLSGQVDLTAIVLMTMWKEKWQVLPHFWTPEKGLKERARQSRTPLDVWANQGLLHVVPGASIDYEVVAKDFVEITDSMHMEAIAFDAWRFDDFKRELDKLGFGELPLVKFAQVFKSTSPALERLETELFNERMAHGNHPVLTMCALNSRVEKDHVGNRKLSKLKAVGRIDGMVALMMAMGVSTSTPEPPHEFKTFFM